MGIGIGCRRRGQIPNKPLVRNWPSLYQPVFRNNKDGQVLIALEFERSPVATRARFVGPRHAALIGLQHYAEVVLTASRVARINGWASALQSQRLRAATVA